MAQLTLITLTLLPSILVATLYFLYRAALPKPIPGIPYHARSAKRVFGDVPDLLKWTGEKQEVYSFLAAQTTVLKSPIIQLFLRPLGKPWVILCDFRESQDIMVRRTREFDRSEYFGDLFYAIMPHNQVHMPTGDEWRAHRRLMGDTMTPTFLNHVVALRIYETFLQTMELWREKMRLSQGRPFSVFNDVFLGALDIVWTATFATSSGVTKAQLDLLSKTNHVDMPDDKNAPVEMPSATCPDAFQAILTISESVDIPTRSPFMPRVMHALAIRSITRYAAALKAKNAVIRQCLDAAWNKFSSDEMGESEVKSALELVVQRESIMARKEGRTPQHNTQVIQDELLGFLVAGHETSSTTTCWGLKFLTANQQVQARLRSDLCSAFPGARSQKANPTIKDIVTAKIPYLDATIEEIHRCGTTASTNIRRALVDTEILGYHIPAGTDVFMMTNGPSYVSPDFPVDESKRSVSSRESKSKTGSWDSDNVGSFMPERWLVTNEKGETEFDARAGPDHPFGGGPRGCFGRKLAELQLRIIIALTVWNFELKPVHGALSNFKARDGTTHAPQQVYVRLVEAM